MVAFKKISNFSNGAGSVEDLEMLGLINNDTSPEEVVDPRERLRPITGLQ